MKSNDRAEFVAVELSRDEICILSRFEALSRASSHLVNASFLGKTDRKTKNNAKRVLLRSLRHLFVYHKPALSRLTVRIDDWREMVGYPRRGLPKGEA